jgi:ATP-dependent DNA ligase
MAFFAGTGQPKHSLVAQIEFTESTPDGHLMHSRFVGLRDDKEAREVVREG